MAPSFSWAPTSFVSKIKNPLLYFNHNLITPSDTNHAIDPQARDHDSPANPSLDQSFSGDKRSPSNSPVSTSDLTKFSASDTSSTLSSASRGKNLSEMEGLRFIFAHFDENDDGHLSGSELRKSLSLLGIETDDDEVTALVKEADTKNNNGTLDFDDFVSFYYNLNQGISLHKVSTSSSTDVPHDAGDGISSTVRSTRIDGEDEIMHASIRAAISPALEAETLKDSNATGSSKQEAGPGEEEEEEEDLRNAFDLFDKNGDGFICAEELQSVLSSMGLKQGKLLIDCQSMIRTFDLNGDGQISFDEFKQMMVVGFEN